MTLIFETLASFVGTIAFSVLFSVPRKQWAVCGMVGGIGWVVYALIESTVSVAAGAFFAAAVIALLARALAVVRKVPANVIVIPGIFPIIPGVSIYNMVYDLFIGNTILGLSACFAVLKVIGAIVLGLVVAFSLPQSVFRRKNPKERGSF